ncbi:MAG: PIN domain-containing protein [Candidatus Micrarchaeota archaeon]
MRLSVDANVPFSAMLREGLTRKLFFDRRLVLFAPRFLLKEFDKYAGELRMRSRLSKKEFVELGRLLLSRIRWVEDGEITPFLPAARHLCSDAKDVPYLACALAVGADLWSRDRDLLQPRVRVWETGELAEALEAH